MDPSARLFNCARCQRQVIICRDCDHGNIYCPDICASNARKASLNRAAIQYRSSRQGRLKNAERQQRFRARQREKVTHQGSPNNCTDDLLLVEPDEKQKRLSLPNTTIDVGIFCHFCRLPCHPFLRNRFIRSPGRH